MKSPCVLPRADSCISFRGPCGRNMMLNSSTCHPPVVLGRGGSDRSLVGLTLETRRAKHLTACAEVTLTWPRMICSGNLITRRPEIMGVEDKAGTVVTPAEQRDEPETSAQAETPGEVISTSGLKTLLNLPVSFSVKDEIRKATYTLANLKKTPGSVLDRRFISRLIAQADGLAFITVVRGSLIFSGQIGTGIVITKLPDGQWSGPSAIVSIGTGIGLQWGINSTDTVLAFKTAEAASAFQGTHLALGASAGLAFGLGRHAEGEFHLNVGDRKLALTYGWSQSKGFYGGGSLDGTIIKVMHNMNTAFYGRKVDPSDLLTGKIKQPAAAAPLYEALATLITEYGQEVK